MSRRPGRSSNPGDGPVQLTFLGAAQNVTGSQYLLEVGDLRLLVDCGLYQERELKGRNWQRFPIPPKTLDAVLLTHAHLDHCGLLPKLVHDGFHGPVYCTDATADIAEISLLDSAQIQEEDAETKRKRHERERRRGPYPELPLYTTEDARACLPLLSPVRYERAVKLAKGVTATFHDAGHVIGSAMIQVDISRNGSTTTVILSGDIGRWDHPILRDPTLFPEADYVLMESTYGDRLHEGTDTIKEQLAEVIKSTLAAGGNIVVPSFALERSQEVLYYLNELLMEKKIPRLKVLLDSPMAVSITNVFGKYPELFDDEMRQLLQRGKSPFEFPGLTLVRSVQESKAINFMKEPAMIVSGAGMCNGGRIKHHLVRNITRPESTILFVGYQAVGTLGRQIVDGARTVRILGETYPVRARIVQMTGFSAHADRDELLRWLSGFRRAPKRLFVVHGEMETARRFADRVQEKTGWDVSVPGYRERVVLE
ncbi:MAG: MBL fold metallo-hydrolase [Chloroflexi bacterium]|nr:MBL fold metallo-hydrolase [Chloroflexota bacterium]